MKVRAIFIVPWFVVVFYGRLIVWIITVIIPHAQKHTTVSLLLYAKMHKLCFFAHNSKFAVVRFCALTSELMKIGAVEILGRLPPFTL